jgi:hypothetical protein
MASMRSLHGCNAGGACAGVTHVVTIPYFCLRRRIPCTIVAVRIRVAPSARADPAPPAD